MIAQRMAFLLAFLVLAAPTTLIAQQELPVQAGDRVRVTAWSVVPGRPVGTLLGLGVDTCVVRVEGRAEPLVLPLESVTRLEVSRGQKSNVGKGAVTGGLIGTAFGLVVGAILGSDPEFFGENAFAKSVAVLGGAGTGVGAIIGTLSPSDRWEEVSLDGLRIGLARHAPDGLAVSASIRL